MSTQSKLIIKTINKIDLANTDLGRPIFVEDSEELYIGQGVNSPPIRIGAENTPYVNSNCKVGVGGVNAFQLVYTDNIGRIVPYDATNKTLDAPIGMALANGIENDNIYVTILGEVYSPNWSLTPGKKYFAIAGGEFSLDPPNNGIIQKIGKAKDENTLIINIYSPIYIGE